MINKKLLVICGPTATGKTSLGIELAKKFNGEIVSADSRQVYKGMDIGTGKDLPKFSIFNFQFSIKNKFRIGYYKMVGIKVWLYDVAEPDYRFNVADYVECATQVIQDIWQRKKLPILVGGTGFYIKALIDGIESLGIPPDWELREKLSNCQIVKLSNLLKELNFQRWQKMNESDRNNPRRLIRAIEIAKKIQISKSLPVRQAGKIQNKIQNSKLKIKNALFVGLKAPYAVLYERIDRRVEERVKQGVIEEIQKLLKKGYNWENSALGTTIGYREWEKYFKSSKPQVSGFRLKEEIIRRWKFAEHAYARRQMTWFRKDKRIHWFDISQKKWQDKIKALVNNWKNGRAKSS